MFKTDAASKGKVATKGQKKIHDDNKATLDFWSKLIFVCCVLVAAVVFFLWDSFGILQLTLEAFGVAVLVGSYKMMSSMATPYFSETGALVDAGSDLNADSGTAEYLKDIVIVTLLVTLVGLYSSYAWLLWLVVPAFAFYKLWVLILGPWFFQEAPPEMDEKKQKKMERKQRRKFI